ncbi:MAG: hypothetical protein PHQ43_08240 [Dehalococcoidales bacterium]|nr:hypothetical protein [Dehalococcoidales bacterium]
MVMDFLEELRRIQSKDNNETFDRSTDSLEALSEAIAWIVAHVSELRPEMSLYEGWQDELGIDFTLWTVTNPATGAAWARGAGAGVMAADLAASAAPNANETARLVGNQRWPFGPELSGVNSILRVTELEWEFAIANLANLDNTLSIFGFGPTQAITRATNNIAAFALVGAGNALQTVTDAAGVETVNTGFGENLANKNKLKITSVQVATVATVQFYLNETLIASHITNLPDLPMYPNWFFDTTAGGACTPQIGIVRIWTEDVIIPS